MKKILLIITSVLTMASTSFAVGTSTLDTIKSNKVLHVGTTGDYKPFSYLNPETKEYEGHDIDAAKMLAKDLGVEVKFVPTTWKTLTDGVIKGNYDIAMSGITRNLSRQAIVGLSAPYIQVGKSPLIHIDNKSKFKTLKDIDQAGVKIGVNIGGTNEKFVDANIKNAEVIKLEKNLSVQPKIISKEIDVMITDNIEAMIYGRDFAELYAVNPTVTFTKDNFGYMVKRDDFAFINWLSLWIEQMKKNGNFEQLKSKWITGE